MGEAQRGGRADRWAGDRVSDSQIITERETLMDMLTDMLGALVTVVTIDAQEARPLPGKVAVLIEPPELVYEKWGNAPDITWRLDVIAGTMATQAHSLDLIMRAIDLMAERELNIQSARPVTISPAGAGDLAAYQLTLNPLEII